KILPANADILLTKIDLTTAHQLVDFAKTLIGIPYKYGSTDPAVGFDCSGFITFVFNHFKIQVPRSSVDFTNVGTPVSMQNAREGDLVLFTGTDDSVRIVGHMSIVTENTDTLKFIHSTSGRANGVTISNLSTHYQKRFVKVIRVFTEQ
ncbi:MAG: C40 family peptidase, partial [Flavobacterium sp.]